eukprot:g1792.t1
MMILSSRTCMIVPPSVPIAAPVVPPLLIPPGVTTPPMAPAGKKRGVCWPDRNVAVELAPEVCALRKSKECTETDGGTLDFSTGWANTIWC